MNTDELTRGLNVLVKRVVDLERSRVIARYCTAAGQVIPANANIVVDFGTRVYDTHKAVTTGPHWKFVAPITDYYQVSAKILFHNTHDWADDLAGYLTLFRNNVAISNLERKDCYSSALDVYMMLQGMDIIYLVAGDKIDIRVNQASNHMIGMLQALPLYNEGYYNYVTIRSLK
jgi:hypothetical protein